MNHFKTLFVGVETLFTMKRAESHLITKKKHTNPKKNFMQNFLRKMVYIYIYI